jgi:D-alanine-D-alanine ligase
MSILLNSKLNIAIIFGGKSVEHDVSIVSAQVVMEALQKSNKYEITPIYITKKGEWLMGDELRIIEAFKDNAVGAENFQPLHMQLDSKCNNLIITKKGSFLKKQIKKIDVVFPIMHGTYGEDGSIAGFCEMMQVPYVGCGVLAGALCMDKIISKQIFAANNIPIVKYLSFSTQDWKNNAENIYNRVEQELNYPIFIKPANLGSSIGISKATNRKTLKFAFEVAAHYDGKIIAEQGIGNLMEVNCAVIGNNDKPIPSKLEEPISKQDFLNFEEKYISKGGSMSGRSKSKVKIPAPLNNEKTKEIQNLAIKVFKVLNCNGIARIDFLLDKNDNNKVYVNEVNPIPGSLQQHLWKASGVEPEILVDKLINFALERFKDKQQYTYTFDSNILDKISKDGLKSIK